jgi:hypothetical protein
MPNYVLTYHQPLGYQPRSDADAMAAWQRFFEGVADRIIDPGQPVSDRRALGDTGAATQLGGYSVVEAADLDAAVALASGCPTLANGGGVQVGELATLPPDHIAAQLRDRVGRA